MSKGLTVGARIPDFQLTDDEGVLRRLSDIQGDDALVLMIGRGEHCPRERQHQKEMLRLQEWSPVAFTKVVTILPNDMHETNKMRIATGAWWPFLCDESYQVQDHFDINEYTDPHHRATVPHTLILRPGELVIDKIYVGYWYWGRPSSYQLWLDLQDLFRRTKADFDPTTDEARAAFRASQRLVEVPGQPVGVA
jgi:peroxiredoxin